MLQQTPARVSPNLQQPNVEQEGHKTDHCKMSTDGGDDGETSVTLSINCVPFLFRDCVQIVSPPTFHAKPHPRNVTSSSFCRSWLVPFSHSM